MDYLTAVHAKLRGPIFSIKSPEAFQVAVTSIVPQPSSLVGALAYCLAISQNISSSEATNKARKVTLAARAAITSEISALSPVLLRRFRILDRGFESKRKGERPPYARLLESVAVGDALEAKRVLERELTDALYREYCFSQEFLCSWILSEPTPSTIIKLLTRLGDTESLCNVVDAWSEDVSLDEATRLSTKYPTVIENVAKLEGTYVLSKMCDENRNVRAYVIPCQREMRSTAKGIRYFALTPSSVSVEYAKPIKYVETSNGPIALR